MRQSDCWVCRRCLPFQGEDAAIVDPPMRLSLRLPFELTPTQRQCSARIAHLAFQGDVLVHAVCGAGKTELMYETIERCLERGLKLAIAVARRQVVLQLAERLQAVYPNALVAPICEGHTDRLEAHLLILTTHQLFRVHQALDLLILDEPDAYPFSHEPVLQGFAQQAVRGSTIYLTATPSPDQLKRVQAGSLQVVRLMRRPHNYDLPKPSLWRLNVVLQVLWLRLWLRTNPNPVLVFVPTKRLGRWVEWALGVPFVHAQHPELDARIEKFKMHPRGRLISTTVLERGVTFVGVDVVVLEAQHGVFDAAALTQMAGRVGRSFESPEGKVVFLCSYASRAMIACCRAIAHANRAA
jgi:competence protein ComFA